MLQVKFPQAARAAVEPKEEESTNGSLMQAFGQLGQGLQFNLVFERVVQEEEGSLGNLGSFGSVGRVWLAVGFLQPEPL